MRTSLYILVLALWPFLISPANAIEMCGQAKRVTCVVDGDTIWLKGEKIRLMGFDTPETTTGICGGDFEKRLGRKAALRLQELLTNNDFTVHRDGEDRYGRTLAVIQIGNTNVGDILIAERLARFWPTGDEFWCN